MPDPRDTHVWPGIAAGVALVAAGAALAAGALALFTLPDGRDSEPTAGALADRDKRASGSPLWPGEGYRIAAVRRGERVEVRSGPGGELVKRVGSVTPFRSPRVFSVLERRGNWIAVATPVTLDNSPGWVRIDTAKLELGRVPHAIVADLGEQRVELHRRGEPVASFPVTIGAAGTSTPPGRFAVTDIITRGLPDVYGCCAVALSARQPNLPPGWLGGDRVAIHGTTGPVGGAGSAGCLRVQNSVIRALISDLPLGTPVTIRV